jgi:hypothetical protein
VLLEPVDRPLDRVALAVGRPVEAHAQPQLAAQPRDDCPDPRRRRQERTGRPV